MAKGIDGYLHTVALHNNNYTIAVLGTGVDICYPGEHLTLMNEIIRNGVVIYNGGTEVVNKEHSILIPAQLGNYEIKGDLEILISKLIIQE